MSVHNLLLENGIIFNAVLRRRRFPGKLTIPNWTNCFGR
jgi:hypothetical protein